MSDMYKPKYLRQEPPTTWEQETAEVFAMVKDNPNRHTDVDKMTAVLEDNRIFLTYKSPPKSGITSVVCTALSFLLVAVIAVFALTAPTIGPRLLSFGTVALFAVAIIINAKGEKRNAQH